MPLHSFRADANEGFQGDHGVVWHGYVESPKANTYNLASLYAGPLIVACFSVVGRDHRHDSA